MMLLHMYQLSNPKNPELFNSIHENLSILQEDETMNQELQIIKVNANQEI